ncbi:MAG: type 1 periplasmic binding fold superfamily protein [Saprospiraceae bacterium]|jgi:hypothetical protein|nr:type 1 periplasmic binding fold superfamily protein [Saprospiraceae bacterium]MBK9928538.1 type 1 periplasmic binding fold superfamily protein [Saprospiraceae bacterium]MBP8942558.1 type 1 periplasmic binding fold superfamily protein [Saprospiraceae bacterium]
MRLLSYISLFIIVINFGCKKLDPIIPNEEEVITTLRYTLVPMTGDDPVILEFKDIDGDGGNPPVYTEGNLTPNTTYLGSLVLLNEQEYPSANITEEIESEEQAHQFFYAASTSLKIAVTYADADINGRPIGIVTKLETGDPSSGRLKITLRHGPNKSAPGALNGIIDNAGGDTDIEIEFNVHVQ